MFLFPRRFVRSRCDQLITLVRAQDASRRGDSLGDTVSSTLVLPSLHAMQSVLARWFVASVADSVVEELNGVATNDGRGKLGRVSGKRAEYWGAGLGTGASSSRWV